MGIVSVEYSFGKATALIYKKQSMGTHQDLTAIHAKLRATLDRQFPI